MNQRNAEIKNYIYDYFVKEDNDLLAIKESIVREGLPKIAVPEHVGKLIYILTKLQKPKRILEVGTLVGYSTTWLAKAAPEAQIITLECNAKHAAIARVNFQNANLDHRIQIVENDALATLERFIKEKIEPFDLIFLDADKEGYPLYLPYLLKLARSGTLLLTDNLIPKSSERINHFGPHEHEAIKTYEYNAALASYPNIETILSTTIVGENGRADALGISLIH